jgi:hypothetical protein
MAAGIGTAEVPQRLVSNYIEHGGLGGGLSDFNDMVLIKCTFNLNAPLRSRSLTCKHRSDATADRGG